MDDRWALLSPKVKGKPLYFVMMLSILMFVAGCSQKSTTTETIDQSDPESMAKHITQAFIEANAERLLPYLEPGEMNGTISQEMVKRYSPAFSNLVLNDFTFELSSKKVFGNYTVFVKHKNQGNERYEFKFSYFGDNYYFTDLMVTLDLS